MYDEGLFQRCLDCLGALATRNVRHKNVFGMRGLLRDNKMFAAVGEESIIVKMPASEFEQALRRAGVRPFQPMGQKRLGRWVEIEESAVADDPDLRDWLSAGLRAI